jgi:hypothetical protein
MLDEAAINGNVLEVSGTMELEGCTRAGLLELENSGVSAMVIIDDVLTPGTLDGCTRA